MDFSGKQRAKIACYGMVGVFALFSARIVHLHDTRYEDYASLAAQRHVRKQPITASRGAVVDRNGDALAISEPLKTLVADGSLMEDPAAIAAEIHDLLEMSVEELTEKLTTDRKYLRVKHSIPETTAVEIRDRLLAKRMRGLHFEQSARRIYPNQEMLCHVVGFMNNEHDGVQGVEMTMNKYLRGRDGFRFIERDRQGREIVPYRGQERPARAGYNVRLTVDLGIQNIVEEELGAACQQYRPEMATALMMEPKTGRILAMANYPTFNVNRPGEGEAAAMKNASIISIVEPGSTFKIITAAASLDDGDVTLSTVINCEGGRFHYGGRILKDHGRGPFPNLNVEDILIRSSNIGVAKLAMKMGPERFYHHLRAFGFGERSGIALPGEIPGILHSPLSTGWNNLSITRMPMGQGVATTPLQMVAAVSAVANGGELMVPQIVEEVFDDEGNTVIPFKPTVVRRVVREETTWLVKRALKGVVGPRGTARRAAVTGFSVAGKTGTAEKANPNGGGYMKGKYVVSFIGFMPVDDPQFVLLVLLDDAKAPGGQNYGGTIAAPVFSKIAERTAHYLGLKPDLQDTLHDGPATKLTHAGR